MTPAEMGRKGGSVTGKTKRRGDAAYYRKLALKAAKARRRKKRGGPPSMKPSRFAFDSEKGTNDEAA